MDIAHLLDFDFETNALGTLRFCALDTELQKVIRQEVENTEIDAHELSSRVFLNTAHRLTGDAAVDSICGGPALEPSDAIKLIEGELDKFAERYGALFFGKCDGRGPTEGQPTGGEFLVFQINESSRLARERTERLLADAKKFYRSTTLESIAQNEVLSNRLGGVIKDYLNPAPDILKDFPTHHNPIKETNEVLSKLLSKVEQMRPVFAMCAELIKSMNSTALQMQQDSTNAAVTADKVAAKSMKVATFGIYISLAALISSCGLSIWTIRDAKQSAQASDLQTEKLRTEIKNATDNANQARIALELAAAEDRKALIRALEKPVHGNKSAHSKPSK